MAWRIVKQPNGLYAQWSDIVDNFTVWNATAEEITEEILSEAMDAAKKLAAEKLKGAEFDRTRDGKKGRWNEALEAIVMQHGKPELDKFLREYAEAELERRAEEEREEKALTAPCTVCKEAPRGEDPGLSKGLCFFCGYLDVPPGEVRERIRAERATAAKESK